MSVPALCEEDALFAKFSVKSLERELATAVQDEEARVAVDEMKKKAIRTAGSYDEFKNLVACAQQKPVDRGALLTFAEAKVTRNRAAVPGAARAEPAAAVAPVLGGAKAPELPKNVHEFTRDWTRGCTTPTQRFEFVAGLPPKRLTRIFAGELDSAILADIATCFDAVLGSGGQVEGWEVTPSAAAASAVTVLSAFPSVKRFGLTVDLLTREDVAVLQRVFVTLATLGEGQPWAEGLPALAALYKCTL